MLGEQFVKHGAHCTLKDQGIVSNTDCAQPPALQDLVG